MKTIIETIAEEWSKKIESGIIDLKNDSHKSLLLQTLHEHIQNDFVIEEIMRKIYDNE
jgi:hypothetical protein